LYLSNEFNLDSGWHADESVYTPDLQKIRESSRRISILDDRVFLSGKNVALPKSDFAEYVLNKEDNFKDLDISEFKRVFDMISNIMERVSPKQ
jgi:hypothetical protein